MSIKMGSKNDTDIMIVKVSETSPPSMNHRLYSLLTMQGSSAVLTNLASASFNAIDKFYAVCVSCLSFKVRYLTTPLRMLFMMMITIAIRKERARNLFLVEINVTLSLEESRSCFFRLRP